MREPDIESPPRAWVQAYNLRRLRSKRGIRQAEMARRAGVERITATRAESGELASSLETLEAFARVLCVSLEELLRRPPKGARLVKQPANRKTSTP